LGWILIGFLFEQKECLLEERLVRLENLPKGQIILFDSNNCFGLACYWDRWLIRIGNPIDLGMASRRKSTKEP
jgi:hypothetical protein